MVPPSTIIHLGHIIAVLRRSLVPVASSSPSSRCRADKALPRHSAGSWVRGTSPSWTCADHGGVVRSVLGSVDCEDVQLHQLRCHNASAYGLRGYMDNTLPLSFLCITMILHVRIIFLKLLRSPTVFSITTLVVFLCRNKSYWNWTEIYGDCL